MSQEPVRVLQVIGAMDRGGAETLLMNLYRNVDRKRVQFDFLVNESRACDYDSEIESLGGKIYRIPRYDILNYAGYKHACVDFFNHHCYPIVHGHIGLPASIYLKEASRRGSFTIAHSHAQNYPLSLNELVFRACSCRVRKVADYFLACSWEAGRDRFGSEIANGESFHILKNGVDTSAMAFDPNRRASIRSELGIDEVAPVLGHVGRLTEVKNHRFLIDVFDLVRRTSPNAKLLLVGKGELDDSLHGYVKDKNLEDSVLFLGIRNDVSSLLSAMDVFVFPSFAEGLSCAAIEAQCSGLPTLLSTGVPESACILSSTKRLDLSLGATAWADAVAKMLRGERAVNRYDARALVAKVGFDIEESAAWIQDFYLRHWLNSRVR